MTMSAEQFVDLIRGASVFEYGHIPDDTESRMNALAEQLGDLWQACVNFQSGRPLTEGMFRPGEWPDELSA